MGKVTAAAFSALMLLSVVLSLTPAEVEVQTKVPFNLVDTGTSTDSTRHDPVTPAPSQPQAHQHKHNNKATQPVAASRPAVSAAKHIAKKIGHTAAKRTATSPVSLPEPVQGDQAIQAVGDQLPAVAAANDMSVAELTETLTNDDTAWLGRGGNIYFAEELPPAPGAPEAAPAATYAAADTFKLHSLPGSTRTIYLDFNGYTLPTKNAWVDYQKMPALEYSGFTLDADATTFNPEELAYIQTVWRIVSEKYATFDIDVTTEDPGAAAIDRSSSADATFGQRVVITDDSRASMAACGDNCSGVAWIGLIDAVVSVSDYYQPAWVFSNMTWRSARLTADTAAHEIGHTVGLNHDGTATDGYYGGHGNWSPIMGGGVNGVQTFSKGEYSGANNTEDDFAVIARNLIGKRADDFANTTAAATVAAPANNYSFDGLISSNTDSDVFGINIDCAANLAISANGIGDGSMLDIEVALVNASGTVLAAADPASGQDRWVWPFKPTGLNATLNASAATAGTYYVRVLGVGHGNPATDGYSNYSSIGSYALTIAKSCASPQQLTTNTITTSSTPSVPRTSSTTPVVTQPVVVPQPVVQPVVSAPWTPSPSAFSGAKRGPKTAGANWGATPGATSYVVEAIKVGKRSRTTRVAASTGAAGVELRLARGRYQFRVQASGPGGTSAWSPLTAPVKAR